MMDDHALVNMSDQHNQRQVDGLLGNVLLYNREITWTCMPKAQR
jgi:hypothetical protein